MSYATSAGLQAAIYDALQSDSTVSEATAGHIYDALPSGSLPSLYVVIGAEEARDRSDQGGNAALYLTTLSVITESAGFASAKQIAGAICDALLAAPLPLSRGRVTGRWFDRAVARALKSGGREITLRFRLHVDDMRSDI